MVGTPQQVEQRFVVVLAGCGQRGPPLLELGFELNLSKTFGQHLVVGQLVDHARMQQQVTGRPARIAEQSQQALVHCRAFQQEGQITFAPQQGLDPVRQNHGGLLADRTAAYPGCSPEHQLDQPRA